MTSRPTAEQMAIIQAMATGNTHPRRSPVLKTPADYGMNYEDTFFSAIDGVPLEAWFIPADSNRLIVCNHPLTMNRYGFPGHLEPWSEFAPVEVEFNKVYKALHDAGYNVLTYDMRNHGHSGAAHGGVPGYGLFEWRDVAGAQVYVQQHPRLKESFGVNLVGDPYLPADFDPNKKWFLRCYARDSLAGAGTTTWSFAVSVSRVPVCSAPWLPRLSSDRRLAAETAPMPSSCSPPAC